jgi:hypothetical protein
MGEIDQDAEVAKRAEPTGSALFRVCVRERALLLLLSQLLLFFLEQHTPQDLANHCLR